jgi:hypothetical protein
MSHKNLVGRRAYGISSKGEKIIGEIIETCYDDEITIYPDGETGSVDETAWRFKYDKITLI